MFRRGIFLYNDSSIYIYILQRNIYKILNVALHDLQKIEALFVFPFTSCLANVILFSIFSISVGDRVLIERASGFCRC